MLGRGYQIARLCNGAVCNSDHHLVLITFRQGISCYKITHDVKQRKYDVEKLKNIEMPKEYKQEIRKILVENKEHKMY